MPRLQDVRNRFDPIDPKVLALRQFEGLARVRAAPAFGITRGAGEDQYLGFRKWLGDLLATMNGGREGP